MSPVNVSSIGSYIREQREQAKISIRQLAQAAGVSNPYLSQVERGLRRPSADILQQIAKGLRISAEALYVQAGILEDRPGDTTVVDAIMADPEITERQKQMLIDIYESFRREVRAAAASGDEASGDAPASGDGAAWDGTGSGESGSGESGRPAPGAQAGAADSTERPGEQGGPPEAGEHGDAGPADEFEPTDPSTVWSDATSR